MPRIVATVLVILAAATLFLFHLGRFISISPAEAQTAAANGMWRAIAGNPLNLPYKVLDFMALMLPFGSLEFRARLASALLALACGLVFFLLVRRWHGERNALLATALFVPSGWLLHTGRFGAGLVMITLMVLGMTAISAWLSAAEPDERGRPLIIYASVSALALLVPGGLWFVLASVAIVWLRLREHYEDAGRHSRLIAAGILFLALALVAMTLIRHPELYRQWLGLPAEFPGIVLLAKQAFGSVSYVFARGPFMPEVWLAHTPLLDAGSAAFLLLGGIFYLKHPGNARVRLLGIFSLISIVLMSVHGAPALAYLAPIIYLVIATGLTYLLHQWLTIFPRNPLARNLAYAIVGALVLTVMIYHTQRYFTAWRNNPDTITVYRLTDSALRRSNLIQ
jgi:MFS family permease